jgi:hypothetical protein
MSMPSPQYQSGPPNRNLGQRVSDARQRAKDATGGRAAQIIGPHLEPGEQMIAGARVHTGPSDWLRWAPYVRLVVRFMQRHYYVMVTDRRLVFCGISFWNARPDHISWMVPRAGVQASDYTAGAIYPSFRLSFPDRKPMRLRIYSSYEPEAMRILGILGIAIPGGQAPGYQPGIAPPYQAPAPEYQPQAPQGYQPRSYDQASQYQGQPQGYQPAPYDQRAQYQAPPQSYQPAPTQHLDPRGGSGRHRGPGA